MRRCDEVVEVVPGRVHGVEAPVQFRWRHRAWQVSAVVACWVETSAWWETPRARGVSSCDDEPAPDAGAAPHPDLLAEQERWRVEARRPGPPAPPGCPVPARSGIFDLVLDRSDGRWRLVGRAD